MNIVISTDDIDGLVLKHQGISSNSAEYAPMRININSFITIYQLPAHTIHVMNKYDKT